MARAMNLATEAAGLAPRVRTRARALNLQPVANDPVEEKRAMVEAALQHFWKTNDASNAAARLAKAAKADLQKAMDEARIDNLTTVVQLDHKSVTVAAKIEEGETSFIDVALLKTLVDDATFMKIVKATKTDVVAHAGNNVAVMATKTKTKAADLSVKEVK